MNHLIVSREYPPSSYAQGGIGTYAAHIARLLAEKGETVHVIGERWSGAPRAREAHMDGRLIVHRVATDDPLPGHEPRQERQTLRAMLRSDFPGQAFAWQVARLVESLVEREGIDIIEAQEYEAPLYYFLLRRALGLGPRRCPPCFVHLHSPSQLICHYNDWEIGRPDHLLAKRFEDYVIQASDAALCPSQYLGRQVEAHFGLAPGTVEQIPYPHGDTPLLERPAAIWRSGTICYFGRMEPRKGVFEWIDAAVSVARDRPELRFELIGSDTSPSNAWPASVRAALQARIPAELKRAITFHDAVPREHLRAKLAEARMAVVPSRWENYPNTCVEAMSTGLPVLATAQGGMVEMVTDGETGWIASAATAEALASTLRRALDHSPETMERMGRRAGVEIRQRCNNASMVERQLAFRRRVVQAGPGKSMTLPTRGTSLVIFSTRPDGPPREQPGTDPRRGLALVVEIGSTADVADAIADLTAQTQAPTLVVVDAPELSEAEWQQLEKQFRDAHLPLAATQSDRGGGLRRAIEMSATASGIAIRALGCRIEPPFLEMSANMLARHPSIGLVSHWHASESGDASLVPPLPGRPYQWVIDDVSPCGVFRAAALAEIDWSQSFPAGRPTTGDIGLAVMLAGWRGLTFPAFLSRRVRPLSLQRRSLERAASVHFRQAVKTRHAPAWSADADDVLALARGLITPLNNERSPGTLLRLPLKDQLRIARAVLKEPRRFMTWVARRNV